MVPVRFWKAAGSTRICTSAGVFPEVGDTVTPTWLTEIVKSVFPPPGSVMTSVAVMTLRLQKLVWTSRSSAEAARRGY